MTLQERNLQAVQIATTNLTQSQTHDFNMLLIAGLSLSTDAGVWDQLIMSATENIRTKGVRKHKFSCQPGQRSKCNVCGKGQNCREHV